MAQAILLKDVEDLGKAGDAVDVSPGYLRNFLVPRKLAQAATRGALEEAQRRREAAEHAASEAAERATDTAALLAKTVLTIQHRAGEDGKLFGAVTAKEIADAIAEARGLRVERKRIQLPEPIRSLGTYMVEVEVVPGTIARVKTIVAEARNARKSRQRALRARRRCALLDSRPLRGEIRRRSASNRGMTVPPTTDSMASAEAQLPPQNLEAEESVLGAMMVSESALEPVLIDVRLLEEDFYRERHRIIFRAIKALEARGQAVDSLTVTEQLTQSGELAEAGGRDAVVGLGSTTPAPGNARHYAPGSSSRTRSCGAC